MPTPMLTQHADGLNAYDLGVVGECQYALTVVDGRAGDIYRRRASDVGSYGGWRWESGAQHPAQYPSIPAMATLAARVAAVELPSTSPSRAAARR